VSDVAVAALEWHRLHFDRANRRYEPLLSMARMILQNRTQDVTAGNLDGFSLLFDMNELFEEYIGEVARASLTPQGWQVVLQGPLHALLQNAKTGSEVFHAKPDITGLRDGKPAWIIDTKWKRLDEDERNQGIAQADVYQMLGYAHRYVVRDVILLYPHQAGIDAEAGLQRSFRIIGGGAANGEQRIHVASVDLRDLCGVPDQLRSILEDVGVNPAQPFELAA
jgi:5-methylcytosine-specific restriction enzyme subunit McrC